MIKFEHVGVTFNSNYNALNDITLQINKGEFVYVLGRSGAGKTTFLRLIYADILPTRGIVRVANDDMNFISKHRIPYLRRQVGIVFQDYMLIGDLSVFDNVRMALDIYYFKKSESRERVWALLKQLGIFELRDELVQNLSGGEKQRVTIARALVNSPQIIIADEPTGNLDEDNANIIMKMLLHAQSNGTTVLMATHDIRMVEKYPARQIVLNEGRLVYSPDKVLI